MMFQQTSTEKNTLKTQQKTTKRFCHAINFLELDLKSLFD